MKEKTCPICNVKFTPLRPIQKVCSASCATTHAINLRDKKRAQAERIAKQEDRKVIQLRKEQLKTRADYAREAQSVFNQYIRARDEKEPCISCGRFHDGQYHAGHYRSVGSHPELRFSELNVHKQCSVCNNHKSGNIVEYRINLAKKIGQEALDWLEGNHEPAKYTIEELKQIKSTYKSKLRELKSER
jgi:hypothetical protein